MKWWEEEEEGGNKGRTWKELQETATDKKAWHGLGEGICFIGKLKINTADSSVRKW